MPRNAEVSCHNRSISSHCRIHDRRVNINWQIERLFISAHSWFAENYKDIQAKIIASFRLLVLFKLVNEICGENMPSILLRVYNEKRVNQGSHKL